MDDDIYDDINFPAGIDIYSRLPNQMANELLQDELVNDAWPITQRIFDLALQFEGPGVLTRLGRLFLNDSQAQKDLERAAEMVRLTHEVMWRIGETEMAEDWYRENEWCELAED